MSPRQSDSDARRALHSDSQNLLDTCRTSDARGLESTKPSVTRDSGFKGTHEEHAAQCPEDRRFDLFTHAHLDGNIPG
jgi:hypothetical protein